MSTDLTEESLLAALIVIKNEADKAAIKVCIKPTGLLLSSACVAHFGSVAAAYQAAKSLMEESGLWWDGVVHAEIKAGETFGAYGSSGK